VLINTLISISFALPAAYAFSRIVSSATSICSSGCCRTDGAARCRAAVLQSHSARNLFDTPWAVGAGALPVHVRWAVWILEGFVSSVPREIDETAFLDGYSFPRFFIKILVPLIASGIGVAAFFCFMFSGRNAAGAYADLGQRQADIGRHDPYGFRAGMDWGLAGRGRLLTIIPGAVVVLGSSAITSRAASRSQGVGGPPSWKTSHGWLDAAAAIFFARWPHLGGHDLVRGGLSGSRAGRDLHIPTTRGAGCSFH